LDFAVGVVFHGRKSGSEDLNRTGRQVKVKVKIKGDGQECPSHKSSLSHTPAELRSVLLDSDFHHTFG